jgi:putative DNA primase/helicase
MIAEPRTAPPRPSLLPLRVDNVPVALRSLDQWLVTKLEMNAKRDKYTKPPYSVKTNRKTDKTDPTLWVSFDTAREALEWGEYDVLGIAVQKHNGIVVIDLDHCRDPETGALAPWAMRIMRLFPHSYMEASISGTGVHIFVLGAIPPGIGKKTSIVDEGTNPGAAIEWNDDSWWYTISGHLIDDGHSELGDGQAGIDQVAAEFWPPAESKPRSPHIHIVLSDDDARARLEIARNETGFGPTFCRLYDHGDITGYPSKSEARWALEGKLCSYLGPDRNRVLEAFRASALWDEKCESKRGSATLAEAEIDKMLAQTTWFYTPPAAYTITAADLPRPNDQVGDLLGNGLPTDIAACHALIEDLVARLNQCADRSAARARDRITQSAGRDPDQAVREVPRRS